METQKLNATVILTIALITVIMTALVSGLLTASQRIPNSGNIKAIGISVYSDQACTTPLTNITWGDLNPGQSSEKTVYLKNFGNVKVELTMRTGNWTPPSASSYLTLTWDRESTILNVGESISATFILSVSPTAQGGPFSFDISIIATEKQ